MSVILLFFSIKFFEKIYITYPTFYNLFFQMSKLFLKEDRPVMTDDPVFSKF